MLLNSSAEFEMGMLEESRADNEKLFKLMTVLNITPGYEQKFYINQTLLKPQKIYLQNFYRIFRHQRYTNNMGYCDIAS